MDIGFQSYRVVLPSDLYEFAQYKVQEPQYVCFQWLIQEFGELHDRNLPLVQELVIVYAIEGEG